MKGSNIRTLSNEEKESAALAIAELIFDNGETGNLTALDISCNNIGDQNMHFIFEALKSNGTHFLVMRWKQHACYKWISIITCRDSRAHEMQLNIYL